ncbi:MAG: glycosyltransferase [Acidobacteriota bacterium]
MSNDGLRVVLPVYNEGVHVRQWWEKASPFLPEDVRVLVVYDFDEDDTLPVVAELIEEGVPMEAVRNRARGVHQAILTGLLAARPHAALVSMADLSDDLGVLPDMLAQLREGSTIVVGSRYCKGGRQEGGPWLKGQLARWGSRVLHWIAGFPVNDASNSFRLYDSRFLDEITIETDGGFEIGFEITAKAWKAGHRVTEVPTTWYDRTAGESRFDFKRWLPKYAKLWWSCFVFGIGVRLGFVKPGA